MNLRTGFGVVVVVVSLSEQNIEQRRARSRRDLCSISKRAGPNRGLSPTWTANENTRLPWHRDRDRDREPEPTSGSDSEPQALTQ
eukprot:3471438-Rhodomonas_salina.1